MKTRLRTAYSVPAPLDAAGAEKGAHVEGVEFVFVKDAEGASAQ